MTIKGKGENINRVLSIYFLHTLLCLAAALFDVDVGVGDGCPVGTAHLCLFLTCSLFLTASAVVHHSVHLRRIPADGVGKDTAVRKTCPM